MKAIFNLDSTNLKSNFLKYCFESYDNNDFRHLDMYDKNEGGIMGFAKSYNKFGL